MKDKQYKIAIVDPPYYSGHEKRPFYGNKVSVTGVSRDEYPITDTWQVPDKEYFDQLFRVSENQIIWGCNYYQYQFGSGRIVWDKVNGNTDFSDCELAYCSFHDSTRMFRFMWNGMMHGKSIGEGHIMQGNKKLNEPRIHPTQKPVLLYKWLLKEYAKPGDNILDTHLGSGSHRIAAWDMSFDFVGLEIDPTHFANQEKRFQKHIALERAQPKINYEQRIN
ncbi:MAG: DNA methyltransferase [Patescibacteria group bacterium]